MCGRVGDARRASSATPEYFGENASTYSTTRPRTSPNGAIAATHRKSELPNYKVFDEKRYFRAGTQPTVFERKGFRIGLLVCEDIWEPEPGAAGRGSGAELLIVINASPFEIHKQRASVRKSFAHACST